MRRTFYMTASLLAIGFALTLDAAPNFQRMLQKIHPKTDVVENDFSVYTQSPKVLASQEDEIRHKTTEGFQPRDFSYLLGMQGFSDNLLKQHFKLYRGYVSNTNQLTKQLKDLVDEGKERSSEYAGLKRMYGWEFGGMRLHEYYFENMGGNGRLDEESPLYQALEDQFGSYSKWKQDFVGTGMLRGVGWAILCYDPQSGKLTNSWVSEHNLGHLAGNPPILVMDVWEHAFITEFGLDRGEYIDAFFTNIDWNIVGKRYNEAQK